MIVSLKPPFIGDFPIKTLKFLAGRKTSINGQVSSEPWTGRDSWQVSDAAMSISGLSRLETDGGHGELSKLQGTSTLTQLWKLHIYRFYRWFATIDLSYLYIYIY